MSNTKTIHGVDIDCDQIKTVEDLKAANFFGHLDSPALKEADAAKFLGLEGAEDLDAGDEIDQNADEEKVAEDETDTEEKETDAEKASGTEEETADEEK